MNTILYFAYGSNMLTSRLRERCPSGRPLGAAVLRRHALHWHKRSKDGSGKCDISKSGDPESVVHGVLYEISEHEKRGLDRAEGLGYGYEQVVVEVVRDGQPFMAAAYAATDVDPTLKPFDWYHAYVLNGAIEHGLASEYIAGLRAVEVIRSV